MGESQTEYHMAATYSLLFYIYPTPHINLDFSSRLPPAEYYRIRLLWYDEHTEGTGRE